MSTAQTIKNVQVTAESIRKVGEELEMNVQDNGNAISLQLKSGSYRELVFKKNSEGNYDLRYDSDRRADAKKLIDCIIQEEAVTQVLNATHGKGNVVSATPYAAFLQDNKELVAEINY